MIESIKPKNASFSATLSKINTKHASIIVKLTLGKGSTSKLHYGLVHRGPSTGQCPYHYDLMLLATSSSVDIDHIIWSMGP